MGDTVSGEKPETLKQRSARGVAVKTTLAGAGSGPACAEGPGVGRHVRTLLELHT